MHVYTLSLVCFFSFLASMFTISTGGTSFITMPLLIWAGIDAKSAIATNMFSLIFLSFAGAAGFRREFRVTHLNFIIVCTVLTVIGSFFGAGIVLIMNKVLLKRILGIMICLVSGLLLFKADIGIHHSHEKLTKRKMLLCFVLVFILGIYGGFFSAGYMTLLSYVMVMLAGFTFLQAAFITKIFNVFSSSAACIFFYYHNLIDFSVGVPMALSASLGAFLGAKFALKKGNLWTRNLFILITFILAIKLLFF